MRISDEGIEFIKRWEGYSSVAYKPTPHDVWTIGWGSTSGVYDGMTITEEEAEERIRGDVRWAERAVNRHVKVGLTQSQFDALVSFVFNLGETNFKKSTLLRELNKGNYRAVPAQLDRWVHQRGYDGELPGLVKRRRAEGDMFLDVGFVYDTVSAKPVEASGRGIGELTMGSAQAKSAASLTGLSAVGLVTEISGTIESGQPIMDKLSGPNSTIVLLAVLLLGVFIFYRRWDDSRKGRAY